MKKFISGFLGVLFVIFVVCGIFVCTYVFNKPSQEKGSDSRKLILGYWTDEDEDMKFYFDQSGQFKMVQISDEDHVYAEGYFKVNEDAGKIKLLIMPNKERDESYDMGEKLKLFAEITYRDLEVDEPYSDKGWTFLSSTEREEIMNAEGSCKFIMSNDDEDVYYCKWTRTVKEFNGDEKAEQRMNNRR